MRTRDLELSADHRGRIDRGERIPDDYARTTFERAKVIWERAFPHRTVDLRDGVPVAVTPDGRSYPAAEMSDGERGALHLILRCLGVGSGSLVVVDEPEAFFHRAVVGAVWDEIERERSDCLFVHLTHDLDFAAGRAGATVLWLRGYWRDTPARYTRLIPPAKDDLERWGWAEVEPTNGLPEPLLLEVLGARRPTLFVEGDRGSLDVALYAHVYPDRHVVPVGGGGQVRRAVGGLRDAPLDLHHLDAAGLVDRDRKSEVEVRGYQGSGVHVLPVAEAENVLLMDGPVRALARHFGLDADRVVEAVHDHVAHRARTGLDRQLREHAESRFRSRLDAVSGVTGEEFAQEARETLDAIDVGQIVAEVRDAFDLALAGPNHDALLRLTNDKGMVHYLRDKLDLGRSRSLPEHVAYLLATGRCPALLEALREVLPRIPLPPSQTTPEDTLGRAVLATLAEVRGSLDDLTTRALYKAKTFADALDAYEAEAESYMTLRKTVEGQLEALNQQERDRIARGEEPEADDGWDAQRELETELGQTYDRLETLWKAVGEHDPIRTWEADMSSTPAQSLAVSAARWAEAMRREELGPDWEEIANAWDRLAAQAKRLQERMWGYGRTSSDPPLPGR